MTADGWTQVVRQQLGLGRLLPLGGPGDGAWLTEAAARGALRRAVDTRPGVRVGALRIAAASPVTSDDSPGTAREPVVPAPPSAVPPGPLRITAELAATLDTPLPVTVAGVRTALAAAAGSLGLAVTEVDLRVTGVLAPDHPDGESNGGHPDGEDPQGRPADARAASGAGTGQEAGDDVGTHKAPGDGPDGEAGRLGAVAATVPGVTRLTGALGGRAAPVRIEEHPGDGDAAALPRRHVRVELALSVAAGPPAVVRAVRRAVTDAAPDRPTVAVLVTALDP
ncbi:nucleopolyhedrovirus P10 family protein [Streptomyces uncialis]|uniref:nucleopolyhedrovirus P10 family protein n=1 Tax=Streptomyces uncialis TaxID=1048205 RepID=UPI0033C7EE20